ncbi:PDR/VanB family oxidoreductase [Defluviimonas sp. SAOS-178_SWC]|uniref:PDR/VanB family oxidoreductase n=1 Tax=Defluviimonas sp. SAOS-178_SWC TaxID=3121287 RepID=UPI003221D687
MIKKIKVRVRSIVELTDRVRSYELVSPVRSQTLPPFTAGAHVTVYLKSGTERRYSLCNDPQESHRYCIAVQREDGGRGGSKEVHGTIQVGDEIEISTPQNHFPMDSRAKNSVLIAGGIGVTPILSMARRLARRAAPFTLLCLARDEESAAFYDEIQDLRNESVKVTWHFDGGDPSRLFDIKGFLAAQPEGAHLYCCGPTGLMDAVQSLSAHWAKGSVHFEYFANDDAGLTDDDTAFTVSIPRLGKSVEVLANQTIIEALEQAGVDVDYSCLEGTCGTCIVPLLEGEADHRDKVLTESELASNIALCCSRAKTKSITIEL